MGDIEDMRRRPGDNLARRPEGRRVWNVNVREGQQAAGDLSEEAEQPEVQQTETKSDPRRNVPVWYLRFLLELRDLSLRAHSRPPCTRQSLHQIARVLASVRLSTSHSKGTEL